MAATIYATIAGIFPDIEHAQEAIKELRYEGFQDDQIGFITKDMPAKDSDSKHHPAQTYWEEGAGVGAVVGVTAGTALGLAAAASMIPLIGPVIAAGAFPAILATMGAGTAAGTLVGGLVGLGMHVEDAKYYEKELQAGKAIVTVNASGRTAEVESIFERHGGYGRKNGNTANVAGNKG
jgi:hypothetical protein